MHTRLWKFTLTMLLLACTGAQAANPPAAYEGRRLFVAHCQLCHGVNGWGDGPLAQVLEVEPANLAQTVPALSDDLLREIVTGVGANAAIDGSGHRLLNAAMPEWTDVFDAAQLDALIAYLRHMSRSKYELPGDPVLGADLYRRYCQICHGAEGEGDGPMAALINIAPTDHTGLDTSAKRDNNELEASILDGKGRFMPAWRDVLNEDEVDALVSYIRLLAD